MATKESTHAILPVNVAHRRHYAEPGSSVLCELWIRGLEKNFDAVKGANNGFGLTRKEY